LYFCAVGRPTFEGLIMPRSSRSRFVTRRTLLAGSAALALAPSRRVWAQADEPLRIGFLTVKTGPLAAGGKQQEEGAALFLKERDGMIAAARSS
jgi:branched-chain amino acid transport system substrate-binding protein